MVEVTDIPQDTLLRDERNWYLRLSEEMGGVAGAREELQKKRRERYLQFVKSLKLDQLQKVTWEDQLEKLGFKVSRNETLFDAEGFVYYRSEYKAKSCMCKVYTNKDMSKKFSILNHDRNAGLMMLFNYPRVQKLIAAFEIVQANKTYFFGEPVLQTLHRKSFLCLFSFSFKIALLFIRIFQTTSKAACCERCSHLAFRNLFRLALLAQFGNCSSLLDVGRHLLASRKG